MENRNGLVVDARLTQASGTAEREAAQEMVRAAKRRHRGRLTVGGDKGFDTQGFVAVLREMGVTPHVAQNDRSRSSAIDGRTTRHKGYQLSQWKRKLIEKVFGWMKTVGALQEDAPPGCTAGGVDVHLLSGGVRPAADQESRSGEGIVPRRGLDGRTQGGRELRPGSPGAPTCGG